MYATNTIRKKNTREVYLTSGGISVTVKKFCFNEQILLVVLKRKEDSMANEKTSESR